MDSPRGSIGRMPLRASIPAWSHLPSWCLCVCLKWKPVLNMKLMAHTWFYLWQQGKRWLNDSWHKLAPPWLKQAKVLCNNGDVFLLEIEPVLVVLKDLWQLGSGPWVLLDCVSWKCTDMPMAGGEASSLPCYAVSDCWVAVNPAVVLAVVLGLFHMCSANLSR